MKKRIVTFDSEWLVESKRVRRGVVETAIRCNYRSSQLYVGFCIEYSESVRSSLSEWVEVVGARSETYEPRQALRLLEQELIDAHVMCNVSGEEMAG